MMSTRDVILRMLKTRGSATVMDVAAELGVTPVSVRHHLSALQAEGLITAQETRRGVGRPHLVYALTEAGSEKFPAKYVRLSDRLLDDLKATLAPEQIEAMFARMAGSIVANNAHRLEGRTLDEKMAILVELLGEEGFLAAWQVVGGRYQLTEYNCPYIHIGRKHPEVCRLDQVLISQVLELPVQKHSCQLNGDQRCTYTILPAGAA
jgi:predicted ArsR family transcriptional regulator